MLDVERIDAVVIGQRTRSDRYHRRCADRFRYSVPPFPETRLNAAFVSGASPSVSLRDPPAPPSAREGFSVGLKFCSKWAGPARRVGGEQLFFGTTRQVGKPARGAFASSTEGARRSPPLRSLWGLESAIMKPVSPVHRRPGGDHRHRPAAHVRHPDPGPDRRLVRLRGPSCAGARPSAFRRA